METVTISNKNKKEVLAFNWKQVLENLDDERLALKILQAFIDDAPKQIKGMVNALIAGDKDTVTLLAHSIKGASANVGGEAISDIAFIMEQNGRAGKLKVIEILMPILYTRFDDFCNEAKSKIK